MNIAITLTAWRRPDNLGEVINSIVAAGGNAYPIHISIDGGFPDEQKEMIESVAQKLGESHLTVHEHNIGAAKNISQVIKNKKKEKNKKQKKTKKKKKKLSFFFIVFFRT